MEKKDNIIKQLWNKITIEQWQKTLRLIIICMVFMVISEGLFEIPAVENFFGPGLMDRAGDKVWLAYLILWIVMFAQVAIIPIPALPILTTCIFGMRDIFKISENIFSPEIFIFVLIITSASLVGAIVAYWIGRKLGKPAIKWAAGSEEDYNKWSEKLNSKTGKWLYAATVILPIFPDDLISLVVGSIKMNFSFYVISNFIGKFVGMFCMTASLILLGSSLSSNNYPIALIIYLIILISAYIVRFVLNKIINEKQLKEIKLEEIKQKLVYFITKKQSSSKDLIIDYKLNKRLKTYLASKIFIHKYYSVNKKTNKKDKIRILIECKASNYTEVLFDKKYKLTEPYETLIQDIKNLSLQKIEK